MKMLIINNIRNLFRRKPPKRWPYMDLQRKWVLKISDEILSESIEARMRTGMRLYCLLPNQCQKIVYEAWFDPYNLAMSRDSLEYWLWNHVFFNKYGEIVILHDHGEILWTVEDFKVDPMFHMIYEDYNHG